MSQALTGLINVRTDLPIRSSTFWQVHQRLLEIGQIATSAEAEAGSMIFLQLHTTFQSSEFVSEAMCAVAEASVIAALVTCILFCSPRASVMVATPKRSQREAVRGAINDSQPMCHNYDSLEDAMARLSLESCSGDVTVDTVERLQGSEASVVICVFTGYQANPQEVKFMLDCRRLNVAISRGKSLCILVTTPSVLIPSASSLADDGIIECLGYMRRYKDRAYCCDIFAP
ncbi:AAA domain-containing protein [Coprinopsis sp. MPI-PUGE-AT-0042]|nr:AAA domain-containing protein [Coprinopsis sp. MPI-PUGE-AT-0042]